MKVLNLVFDKEDLNLPEEEQESTTQDLTCQVIKSIIFQYGQQNKGLNEEERRKYYKICDTLEGAVKDKVGSIELDDDWVKFIKICKSKTRLIPNKMLQKVENLIDGIKAKSNEGNGE